MEFTSLVIGAASYLGATYLGLEIINYAASINNPYVGPALLGIGAVASFLISNNII